MIDFDVLLSYFIDCLLQCYRLFHAYSHKKKEKKIIFAKVKQCC